MTIGNYHLPVMVDEVVEFLRPKSGGVFVDATIGGGGHAEAILKASKPDGVLIGIDRDEDAIDAAKKRFEDEHDRTRLVKGRMGDIAVLLSGAGYKKVNGVFADLGVSSHQVDLKSRGFSFMSDAPLDMRMDFGKGESAAELLRRLGRDDIERLLREFGEERYAARIADAISRVDVIKTTGELASLVIGAIPPHARRSKIHPATRTFQAIRIAVNDELGELERFLNSAPECLAPGGRLVVISYHSLEDRMVKRRFRALSGNDDFHLPRRRVLRPSDDEVAGNPRSRSAKLRVIERTT